MLFHEVVDAVDSLCKAHWIVYEIDSDLSSSYRVV